MFGRVSRRWSLRSKLALVMAGASVLPLVFVGLLARGVAMGRLERELSGQARQTAGIALNLLLRQVQRMSTDAASLAAYPELHELLALQPALVPSYLERHAASLPSQLVEVVGARGEVLGRIDPTAGGDRTLHSHARSPAVAHALEYERYATLDRVGGHLVIQTAAPIVDEEFILRGVVVITAPLDEKLADYLKGVVRADVGFVDGGRPVASTFFDPLGRRLAGLAPLPGSVGPAGEAQSAALVHALGGREYSLGVAALQTVHGDRVGLLVVGLDRTELERAQSSAVRSLAFGGAFSLVFALVLAFVLGRRITTPLSRLQRRTRAVAAGDLTRDLAVETDDEIGQLARAFQSMTDALRENQERLAARIRELSTLHQISRAVTSELSLDHVLRQVVREAAVVLQADRGGLWLVGEAATLELRAAVGLDDPDAEGPPAPGEARVSGTAVPPEGWIEVVREVSTTRRPEVEPRRLAIPLEAKERVAGVLILSRAGGAPTFAEADVSLVVTFGGQAATAIENARLYAELTAFSEQLEWLVARRTAELQAANEELARTVTELKDTQSQLIHSERMAGLGTLVAGLAHEINTPAGAIHGSAQVLSETLTRALRRLGTLLASDLPADELPRLVHDRSSHHGSSGSIGLLPPAEVRRRARELTGTLEGHDVPDAARLSRRLVEADAGAMVPLVASIARRVDPDVVVGFLEDLTFLERSAASIQTANRAVVRIVRALRSYAHTDQGAIQEADLTEGLETTLTILHNELRYGISVERKFAPLPKVAVFADELNQVWTNLIHNAVQAMQGHGRITIETFRDGEEVGVRISDSGPGIPTEILPRIFEPFFSTKPRGEGTGLGLGIARKIIEKHGGQIAVQSRPGLTTFTVLLPIRGPTALAVLQRDAARGSA